MPDFPRTALRKAGRGAQNAGIAKLSPESELLLGERTMSFHSLSSYPRKRVSSTLRLSDWITLLDLIVVQSRLLP
jgi:hypothetical protein